MLKNALREIHFQVHNGISHNKCTILQVFGRATEILIEQRLKLTVGDFLKYNMGYMKVLK